VRLIVDKGELNLPDTAIWFFHGTCSRYGNPRSEAGAILVLNNKWNLSQAPAISGDSDLGYASKVLGNAISLSNDKPILKVDIAQTNDSCSYLKGINVDLR
jgi:hypothetical protein